MERPLVLLDAEVGERGEVFFASRKELANQLQEREQQLMDVARQAAQWEQASREVEETRALLSYTQNTTLPIVAARVLGRSAPEFPDTFLIDRGASDGVRVEQPVIGQDHLLIGTVQEVFAETARVKLLRHADTRIGATLLGQRETLGVIEGLFEPLLRLSFVPQETEVAQNDVVVTSGADPLIPQNLIIGLVRSVEKDPNTPFLNILVESLVDVSATTMVGVVTGL
ncbi:MAG: rod shape-determining protein MreC [Patescibacteria group bacterium]